LKINTHTEYHIIRSGKQTKIKENPFFLKWCFPIILYSVPMFLRSVPFRSLWCTLCVGSMFIRVIVSLCSVSSHGSISVSLGISPDIPRYPRYRYPVRYQCNMSWFTMTYLRIFPKYSVTIRWLLRVTKPFFGNQSRLRGRARGRVDTPPRDDHTDTNVTTYEAECDPPQIRCLLTVQHMSNEHKREKHLPSSRSSQMLHLTRHMWLNYWMGHIYVCCRVWIMVVCHVVSVLPLIPAYVSTLGDPVTSVLENVT
jgi:hypothetical protein